MKKITIVLVVLSMILTVFISPNTANGANAVKTANTSNTENAANASNASNAEIRLRINSQIADLKGYAPYKSTSGIMVPLAEASQAVGASVEYIKSTKEVKVILNSKTLVFKAGRKIVLVNGKSVAMGENAVNIKGKVYVPVKFLFEKLGGTVGWDNKTYSVVVNIKITSATKPVPTPSDNINVSMTASADFKPYIAELTPVPSDILAELKAYKDDKDGKDSEYLYKTPDGKGISYYRSNEDIIKSAGIKAVEDYCLSAKGLMEVENNVDYRTLDNNWIQQYRYFFTPGISIKAGQNDYVSEDYIAKRYNDIKKFKVVEKAEFFTDTSMLYKNKNSDFRIRGRLKFMYESVDPQYFTTYGLAKYELNKWYYSDVEICAAIIFDSGTPWPHAYKTYLYRVFLNNTLLPY